MSEPAGLYVMNRFRLRAFQPGALLREPILVFALVAAALFAADALRDDAAEPMDMTDAEPEGAADVAIPAVPQVGSRRIVVTAQLEDALREEFVWLEGRQPDADELDRLLDRWIEDEILFQEGLTMQLHRWDTKVRERVVSRVRMLWAREPAEPDEAVLLDYYIDHLDYYRTDPRIIFDHHYLELPPSKPAAETLLRALRRGEQPPGDVFWLGAGRQDHGESVLRAAFGGEFLAELRELPAGEWVGPIESPRGTHFLRKIEQVPSEARPYAAVREQVLTDWAASQRQDGVRQRLDALSDRYTIVRTPVRFQ